MRLNIFVLYNNNALAEWIFAFIVALLLSYGGSFFGWVDSLEFAGRMGSQFVIKTALVIAGIMDLILRFDPDDEDDPGKANRPFLQKLLFPHYGGHIFFVPVWTQPLAAAYFIYFK